MKIINNFALYSLVFLFSSASLISGGIISNGARMNSTVVDLQGDHIEANDVEYIGSEKMKIMAWNYFKGSGLLKAPEIIIKTKKFEFTGTIFCDQSCVITTEQPFNHTMFKQAGNGKFSFVVKPMPDPIKISINGYSLLLKDNFEQRAAECMKEDAIEKFNDLISSEPEFAKDKDLQRVLLNMACIFKAYKIAEKMCSFSDIINPQSPMQDSPLLLAVVQEDNKLVQLLIDRGADVNQKYLRHHNLTVLILASDKGYLNIVKALLKVGADTSASLIGRPTRAIDCAQANGHRAIVRYLNNPDLIKADEEAAKSKVVQQNKQQVGLFKSILQWIGY